jgi:hypothetical protein
MMSVAVVAEAVPAEVVEAGRTGQAWLAHRAGELRMRGSGWQNQRG